MIAIDTIENILPPTLRRIYRSNTVHSSTIVPVANRFANWFGASGIPFFKFYTDHSEKHCIDVFRTAIEFIATDAYEYISAQDLSILMAVCFCHDCGMHITELQFRKLVAPDNAKVLCALDQLTWPELWNTFLEEAGRFNQQKLVELFGDTKPIEPVPEDVSYFTDRTRHLIGEFLRRHHTRLAHDLCLGLCDRLELPDLFEGFSPVQRDIIGLISRSHGMSLRECYPYIEKKFNLRDFNGIHIVYLMVLLRLADYAQIQADRASLLKSQLHLIKSPISAQEWRVHNSIRNITLTHDDPESIFIESEPRNVSDYLRVRFWLDDLQAELDKSWAVLGELYGRQQQSGLDKLSLSIRRARSSVTEGNQDFDFLPEKIRFRVSESEMLLLLLAPLYGDHPGYGVRELLQNAHDAIVEAMHLEAAHLKSCVPEIKVKLVSEADASYLEISDNGVGMTPDVIKNYFLNAGASFRSSDQWKRQFVDMHGDSQVVRSGRFGVGALAAFLVGDKIKVYTRHYLAGAAENGWAFEATLAQTEIEVRKADAPVGTRIVIDVTKGTVDALRRWFDLADLLFKFEKNVQITCEVHADGKVKAKSLTIDPERRLAEFSTDQYNLVTLCDSGRDEISYVNGIAVCTYIKSDRDWIRGSKLCGVRVPFHYPLEIASWQELFRKKHTSLRILDPNANCPLNLARTAFTKADEGVRAHLEEHAYKGVIEVLKTLALEPQSDTVSTLLENCILTPMLASVVLTSKGICPASAEILNACGLKLLIRCEVKSSSVWKMLERLPDGVGLLISPLSLSPSRVTERLRELRGFGDFSQCGALAYCSKSIRDRLCALQSLPAWLRTAVEVAPSVSFDSKDFLEFPFGKKVDLGLSSILAGGIEINANYLEVRQVNNWTQDDRPFRLSNEPLFSRLWGETVGGVIPFHSKLNVSHALSWL